MKKSIVALLFFVTISAGAFAQERRGGGERMSPEKRAEMQTKRMTEQLGLNDDQQKKVLALNVERTKKSQELGQAEASKRQEIREAYVKELNTILTPEQQEKLKNAQSEGRGPRDGAARGRKGGKGSKPQN